MNPEKNMLVMRREDTVVLKGCAILIMVFLHLFNDPSRVALCRTYLEFNGEPLVLALSRCAGICVPLYVFLSGYGLYLSRAHTLARNGRRVASLYVRFWLVLALFLVLACWLRPETYPGSLMEFLYNFTGLNTTYNGEWWFLLPYALLALSSPVILSSRDRWGNLLMLFVSGTLYLGAYLVSKYAKECLGSQHLVSLFVNYVSLLFSFLLGICSAHIGLPGRLSRFLGNKGVRRNLLLILFLIIGFGTRMLYHMAVFDPLYAVFFIVLFSLISRPEWLTSLLTALGRQSVNMWLVHTVFCYHLFPSFTYGLRYPLLIFLFVVAASYLTGILIERLNTPLQRLIFRD